MTEPGERKSHHPEKSCSSSGSPSGGSSGDALEHLRGGPENGDRGRQREPKPEHHERDCGDTNTDKLWPMKGAQRRGCPDAAAAAAAGDGDRTSGSLEEEAALTRAQQQEEESPLIDSDTGLDARLGKKRHRRRNSRKKRNWKPYYKLSWDEKKALDEKETARASRVREEMFAKGLPVAPYNTTQFLMDEHDREEPDLNTETGVRRASGMEDTGSEEEMFDNEEEDDDEGSGGGSDGIGRPGNAGGEFLQRDFSETYEMYHVESLQNMTKQELVQEYLELEKCMSRLEEENNRLRRAVEPGGLTVESSLVRLRELERELERLRAQNTELLLQNQPSSTN